MNFEKKIFKTKDVTLTYYIGGDGEPLLFLHGVGVKALTYHKILSLLGKQYTVIAPDLPGFGESSMPMEVWNLEDYAQVFDALITELKLRNVTVVGHSWGGRIALMQGLVSKDKVKKVIIINSGATPPVESKRQLVYLYFFGKNKHNLKDRKHLTIMFQIAKDFMNNIIKNFFHLRHLFNIVLTSTYKDYPQFKNIDVPVTAIISSNDVLLKKSEIEDMKKLIPQMKVVEIEGNHDTVLFDSEIFLQNIAPVQAE